MGKQVEKSMSNKKVLESLKDLKWNASSFDPQGKKYDSAFYENQDFFKYALRVEAGIMEYAPEEFKSNKEIAELAVLFNYNNLDFVSDEIKADEEFIKKVIRSEPSAIRYLKKDLLLNKEFLKSLNDHNVADLLKDGPEELKQDREFVLKYIGIAGYHIEHLSSEFKNDRDVALRATRNNAHAMEFVSDELKKDKNFVLEVVRLDGRAIAYIAEELLSDREIALAAISNYGGAMNYIDKKFHSDKEIVLAGVLSRSNVGDVYRRISDELNGDREFMKKLLFLDNECFDYLNDSLRKDPEFVLIKKLYDL